jgi:predicted permease
MADALIGTAVPILLLMGIGFLSRKFGILKLGDERVLSAYVYFFALPALFVVDLAETSFAAETLSFIFAGIIPVFVVVAVYGLLYVIFRFSRNTLYLLTLSTIFGSLAFFGIPFVTFAFPSEQTERLATLAAATIGIVAIAVSITMLEFYRLGESPKLEGLKQVATRLARNPLIISIVAGILISVVGVEIPSPVSTFLHMMGGTTSAVAVFMLGAFLYGKKYANLTVAFGLSLLRIVFLPAVALATLVLFNLPTMDQSVLVLMHAMPIAVSLSVLSERYNFYRETVASLTLISSVGAIVYLNIWLFVLGI